MAEHGGLQHLLDSVREHKVARAARERLGERVTVTVDDDRLFAYTEAEPQAHEAERVLRELAADRGLEVRATVGALGAARGRAPDHRRGARRRTPGP